MIGMEFEAVYAIWLREMIKFVRQKERILSALASPLVWFVGIGFGLGPSVDVGGVGYQQFVFPGILAMNVLFSSLFYGVSIIEDKRDDFLKEVLVAPVSRMSIFAGKLAGGVSISLIQSTTLLLIGMAFFGLGYSLPQIALALAILALTSAAIACIGLLMGAYFSSPEAFNLIIGFVLWPMFIFSGALFPTGNLPPALVFVTALDPLSYGVDGARLVLAGVSANPLWLDVAVLVFITMLAAALGGKAFGRLQTEK